MPSLSTSIHGTLAISLLGLASSCSFSLTLPGDEQTQSLWVQSIDNSNTPSRWMSDFPAEADMAVILDVQVQPSSRPEPEPPWMNNCYPNTG